MLASSVCFMSSLIPITGILLFQNIILPAYLHYAKNLRKMGMILRNNNTRHANSCKWRKKKSTHGNHSFGILILYQLLTDLFVFCRSLYIYCSYKLIKLTNLYGTQAEYTTALAKCLLEWFTESLLISRWTTWPPFRSRYYQMHFFHWSLFLRVQLTNTQHWSR